MEIGEWYREKAFNAKNGKEEWKYYYIREIIPENNSAEMDIYRIYFNGRVSAPRKWTSPVELIETLTKVSGDYACSVLKIKPPQ
ncbi:MAG: hypothetical protein RBT69_03265 [Spirochaetia bacterium]|jgi:hypothetical protein|nr:hypothetical protein [Spirochaetia bacterium]